MSSERSEGPGVIDAVAFLESAEGRRVFSWWQQGFVPSVLLRTNLSPEILGVPCSASLP